MRNTDMAQSVEILEHKVYFIISEVLSVSVCEKTKMPKMIWHLGTLLMHELL